MTYLAKRRAEIAPMVGSETDMLVIAEKADTLHVDIVQTLETSYQRFKRQEVQAGQKARTKMRKWVDEFLVRQAQATQPIPAIPVDRKPPGA